MGVVSELNVEEFSKRHVLGKYPYFLLNDLNQTTSLVVSLLEEGEIPLVGFHNGVKKIVKYISISAFNIDKLLRTHGSLTYVISEKEFRPIRKVTDYLEVFHWIY